METISHQFDQALKRLGGDEELFYDLATYFIEDSPDLVRAIHAGLAAARVQEVQRAAHTLRGLAANFDAEPAMTLAGAIEQMAAKGDWRSVPATLAHLESEVQHLRTVLEGYQARTNGPVARN